MNETDPQPATTEANHDVREQCTALQGQINNLLLALAVLSCTLTLYLIWQVRQIKRQYDVVKQQATAALQQKAQADQILSKLSEYGRTHPDFEPILNKYKIPVATTPPSTPAQPVKPGTASPPAPKK